MTEVIDTRATVDTETSRTAADAAIEQLEACGARVIFGIPGVHTLALYDALHTSTLTHILARHEQGAGSWRTVRPRHRDLTTRSYP